MADITLKSNDSKTVKISIKSCKLSNYLKSQVDLGKKEIVLDDIKGDVLAWIGDYMNHYESEEQTKIPDVLSSNDLISQLGKWDFNFISNVNYELAFNLINAGVLLEIDHWHDLACARIAAFMKGKTPDEVNKEFTIECQLTQEEAKELGWDTQE